MCGGCRLSVGGKTKFACVDGPDFNGHEVDFNEAIARSAIYRPFEAKAYETCKLLEASETIGKVAVAERVS
jgi:ferredoxin--NADP+ reductase